MTFKTSAQNLFIIVFVLLFMFAGVHSAHARSRIDIRIELDKTTYATGEELTGTIRLSNYYPATVPVTFFIEIFKDNNLIRSQYFSTKAITGHTDFDFDEFVTGTINTGAESVGLWKIIIHRQSDPPLQWETAFRVISNTASD